jgi:response regulator RpfG family c-di-GMP phosphodiesterase
VVKSKVIDNEYLILSDEDESSLNVHAAALKYFYGGRIITSTSHDETIDLLNRHGRPELLFVDYNLLIKEQGKLHSFVESSGLHMPMIAAQEHNADPTLLEQYPVSTVLYKPVSVEALTNLVKQITSAPVSTPSHVPISIQTLLQFTNGEFDFYIKLSGKNYIKIINEGDIFTSEDAEKLLAKGIKEVHVKSSDSHELLKICESKLLMRVKEASDLPAEESVLIVIGAIEQVETISKALGWTNEVTLSAQKTVTSAVELLVQNAQMTQTLKKRFLNPSSPYAMHIGLQTYLTCGFCKILGWTEESTQIKLAMASLLHDVSLEESYYEDIRSWNKKASNSKIKSSEVTQYRNHPFEGSKFAGTLKVLPPDVEKIILQHHETPDGKGFPRGLVSNQISSLASLFIMIEDLIGFIGEGRHIESSISDYLTWGETHYSSGFFKKIFDVIKEKISSGV